MNATIRDRAKANRLVVETDAERRPPKGKAAPKDTAAGEELPSLEEVNQMPLEELESELPAVEEVLESAQSELAELQGRRDEALGLVAAMGARVVALGESEEEGQA